MVAIVIVSHSARLAQGAAELARGMAGPDVPLAAVGGLDLPDQPLGTDAALIQKAIENVYQPDGVVVLMDLGSAILSTEMALEALPPERRERIVLCEAPLVEGALAAAVQSRLGASLAQVLAEARGALAPKAAQLGLAPPDQPAVTAAAPAGPALTLELAVRNRLGLHARPAARLVQTAGQFAGADVHLRNVTAGRGPVSAKSINAVATLGVRQGQIVEITAAGLEAEAALAALQRLADDNFGDVDEAAPAAAQAAARPAAASGEAGGLLGLPVSPGIALGPARLYQPTLPDIPAHLIDDPQAEWDRLLAALDQTRAQIQAARAAVAQRADRYAAAIFDAHLLFLDDEALRGPARAAIFDERLNAAAAWQRAVDSVSAAYQALDDDYLRARAADVADVGRQTLLNLGNGHSPAPLSQAGIVVAGDLSPADTAALDPSLVMGVCTAYGGPTSHAAILARALGVPAVAGLGPGLLAVAEGTVLLMDGATGQVWPEPAAALAADYARRAEVERSTKAAALAASAAPAVTRDGRRIEIAANIGSVADAQAALAAGAEGVGLFRTEFLFLDRRAAPDEEEQYAIYRAAAAGLEGRPVIIRTLDAGGDKPLPYLDLGPEANPFLGWRAVRVCLDRPEFFKVQLRAIVRAAAEFPVRVMFPMVATLGEWRQARDLLAEARAETAARGLPVPASLETGIMIEIPAAALRAKQFAAEVDFFSIGTNDLTQYVMAAERGNPRVAALADSFHPAVLDLIGRVARAAHALGKWAGVCGEFAGDPLAVPLLVGLGIDELSMSAPAIPRAKAIVRDLEAGRLGDLVERALAAETAADVRALARQAVRSNP